jgi:prepilin-type N-terminal cleavage/methylation domain-containing protein
MTKNRTSGFTLLEIMVALGILSVIMGTVYGSYCAITGSLQRVVPQSDQQRHCAFVLNRLCRQLRCCYAGAAQPKTGTKGSYASPEENQSKQTPLFVGKSSGSRMELCFVAAQADYRLTGDGHTLCTLHYQWDTSSGILRRTQQPYASLTPSRIPESAWRMICEQVQTCELEFYDGREWSSQWAPSAHKPVPLAIRMHLAVGKQASECVVLHSTVALTCLGDRRLDESRETRKRGTEPGKGGA